MDIELDELPKNYRSNLNTINSLNLLFKIIIKDFNDSVSQSPYNDNIIDVINTEIDTNCILLKNIKLIKINFNKIINLINYQLNFNNIFKKEIYNKIFNNIYDYQGNDQLKGINYIPSSIVKIAKDYNGIYCPSRKNIKCHLIDNVLFINITTANADEEYLSTKITYKIDLNNNKLFVYQKINKQYINFLNHLHFNHFKFILHKNNVLIGYKYI